MHQSFSFRRAAGAGFARAALMALFALAVLWPSDARAWWDEAWPYRIKINLDAGPTGAAITEPIGRSAVLLRLHVGNFSFEEVKEDGSDLRFVAGDDQTPLKFHIEKFDGLVEQVGLVWVSVPDLAPGVTTSIYLYYGNPDAVSGIDSAGTYDADQVLVYHFADREGAPKDRTGFGNDATAITAAADENALIGPGLRFDGAQTVTMPASASLSLVPGQALTWSMWIKPADATQSGVLYDLRDAAGGGALTIGIDQGVVFAEIVTPTGPMRTTAGSALRPDSWHHVAVTASDRLAVWVDGAPQGEVAAVLPAMNGAATIGGEGSGTVAPGTEAPGGPTATLPRPGFRGQIDELQISKTVRPAGFLQAAVRSQGVQANLVVFEGAEQTAGFGTGYLGFLLRAVTIDGWIVIAICALIAPLSWWVIWAKTAYLNRMARANRDFEEAFRATVAEQAQSPRGVFTAMANGAGDSHADSGMYRLYDVGSRELLLRAGHGERLDLLNLGPESLTAIRAALDSRLVQESERLNSQMVLLTIAISGGPFLGLLGTVVGVMITFAAVGLAGDVNVNAIAPGIAAALVATVAGLAVAIPALFGYNYLLVRIKDVSAKLQMFSNELLSRMAETFKAPSYSAQRLAGE